MQELTRRKFSARTYLWLQSLGMSKLDALTTAQDLHEQCEMRKNGH